MKSIRSRTNISSGRKIVYVGGIDPQPNLSGTFKWNALLEEIRAADSGPRAIDERVLPVALFGNPPLGHFLKVMHVGLKLEVCHDDYKEYFPDKEIYWIASIMKIVGYQILVRYEGMDQEGDDKHDIWVNICSAGVKHVGYCASHEISELLPPVAIRRRQTDWSKYIITKLHACKTLTSNWENERQLSLLEGRFPVGTRLELLDRYCSSRVRPARVIAQLGRRICLRVGPEDVDKEDLDSAEEDAQVDAGIWCDESYELIFHVGWATQNSYGLVANAEYKAHCEAINRAIQEGQIPNYAKFDASPDIFNDWKENVAENAVSWEVGMKFECLDPLNQSFLELKVATCLKILNNGYLKVGFDGPDMEEEAIPIHCTSPYLFPINYASEHGITTKGPPSTKSEFSWKEYLRQSQAAVAPDVLFDPIPPLETMARFKIGAKLEATDQCEPQLVCPATICAVRGRLLQVHFDGWDSGYDQLFDYRSRDLFPLGWAEMYGYRLEVPKGTEPLAKRRKK